MGFSMCSIVSSRTTGGFFGLGVLQMKFGLGGEIVPGVEIFAVIRGIRRTAVEARAGSFEIWWGLGLSMDKDALLLTYR